jgi:hypothetical protein
MGGSILMLFLAVSISVGMAAEAKKGASAESAKAKPAADSGDSTLVELYQGRKILSKPEYAKIRHVFAAKFEKEQAEAIDKAFGEPAGEFRKWLDRHPDLKEEFFLAIDPKYDDIPKALALFKQLHDLRPEKFADYGNLAIAVSVVWDKEAGAIHESPCGGSIVPEGQMGGVENYEYYLDLEQPMQGWIRYLPWEFLVHAVNHRTTLPERKWAILNYLPKRAMIGKCRGDVPYDWSILKGEPAKLAGKIFTLPNQKTYGGICGGQSDFATRVSKSLGIPAFTACAANKFGGGHAWMMWVELGSVSRTNFNFSLQSEGRFFGDKYYVGDVQDPHTGQHTTDRRLELELHTIGMDPIAKRQTDLVMRAYPMLCDKLYLALPEKLEFLNLVIKACPGNQEVWRTLARMSKNGEITKANAKPMQTALDAMFRTFAKFPDFTWEIFDDFTAFEDRAPQRAAFYAKLAGMYEQADRIDLSCEARLKHADLLAANGHAIDAIGSLSTAVMLFPDEGRYVPKMLDKLDALCKDDKSAEERLAKFYIQFLPKIPKMRGDEPSDYCLAMYQRGIDCFNRAGMADFSKKYRILWKLLENEKPANKKLGKSVEEIIKEVK